MRCKLFAPHRKLFAASNLCDTGRDTLEPHSDSCGIRSTSYETRAEISQTRSLFWRTHDNASEDHYNVLHPHNNTSQTRSRSCERASHKPRTHRAFGNPRIPGS
jgi:hypothetical protein